MDSFQVKAKQTGVLETSHLVNELETEAREMEMFPVLIGTQVGYFHDVDGGFSSAENGSPHDGYHVVNLIHRVQGPDSPPNKTYSDSVEIHMDDWFYNLTVEDVLTYGDYPDEDFVLSLQVTDYMTGPETFSEALTEAIDKREQEFSPNGERR
jgi:hypothetical protein